MPEQTWYPDEVPGELRSERYCPNERCPQHAVNVAEGTHCQVCGFYLMPGVHRARFQRRMRLARVGTAAA